MAGDNKKIDPAVLAAIITVVGGIIVTLITTFANRPASLPPTPIPPATWTSVPTATITDTPVPTATTLPGMPSSTPAPDTATPQPSDTPPPPALGDDWANGCISSLWKPYPSLPVTVQNDNCLAEPVGSFSADKGTLYIASNRAQRGPVETDGLFAPLPESGSVTVTVYINDLTNVDLWVGIFSKADINSQGLLFTIPAGKGKKHVIVEKDPLTYTTLQGTQNLDQGGGYNITLSFDALTAKGTLNPNVFVPNPISLASSQKWLFIGYRGLSGTYSINAYLFNFQLKK